MTDETGFLGVSRTQQEVVIALAGIALVITGLLTSSAVDSTYNPTLFGVGVVMLLYAVVAFTRDRVTALVSD